MLDYLHVYDQDEDLDDFGYPRDWVPSIHPFWHVCRKCAGWVKIGLVFLALDVASEFVTFLPIHKLFESLGWI